MRCCATMFLGLMALSLVVPDQAMAEKMRASWYDYGTTTASGEHFDPDGATCASRTFPFGTLLRLRWHGQVAECRVNDRGPYIKGRQLDMSRGVARKLGAIDYGVVDLDVQVLAQPRK